MYIIFQAIAFLVTLVAAASMGIGFNDIKQAVTRKHHTKKHHHHHDHSQGTKLPQANSKNGKLILNTPRSILRMLEVNEEDLVGRYPTYTYKREKDAKDDIKNNDKRRSRRTAKDTQIWSNQDRPTVMGWDCSEPESIRKIAFNNKDNCDAKQQIRSIKNVSLTLLQHTTSTKHKGFSCSLMETKRIFQCGMFDHAAVWTTKSYFDVPREITKRECAELRRSGEFKDDAGTIRRVKTDGTTILNYDLAGRTWNEGTDLNCQGQDFVLDGQTLHSAVIHVQQTFTIEEDTIIAEKNIISSKSKGVYLPCAETDRSCVMKDRTYIWEIDPKNTCEFRMTRQFQATWIEAEDGRAVVMSSDGSLIRLVIDNELIKCGHKIFRTNYPGLFLTKTEKNTDYDWKRIDPEDVSIQAYIANRDDFVYHIITHRLREEFQEVIATACKEFHNAERFRFLALQSEPGLASWVMGNGTFATVGGETMFVYTCQQVVATPRKTKNCYQALPVNVIAPQNFDPRNRTWFVEPNSRRLTSEGIQIPCSDVMAPNMKTTDNRWIAYGQSVQYVEAPGFHQMDFNWTEIKQRLEKNQPLNFPKGGLYRPQDIIEYFMDFNRRRNAISYEIAGQTVRSPNKDANGVSMAQMFPSEELYGEMKQQFLGSFLGWIESTGSYCSIAVCVYLLIQLTKMLVTSIQDGTAALAVYGFTRDVMWFFCLRFITLYEVNRKRKEELDQKRQRRAEVTREQQENIELIQLREQQEPPPYPEEPREPE